SAWRPRPTHPFAAPTPPRKMRSALDLHVLSTPPAFILSQDQTLHQKLESHGAEAPQPKLTRHPDALKETIDAISTPDGSLTDPRAPESRQRTRTGFSHTVEFPKNTEGGAPCMPETVPRQGVH